jgi:hypothetical protein
MCQAAKLGLALAAARLSKDPDAYRTLLTAIPEEPNVTRAGMDGALQDFEHMDLRGEAILGTRDEALIRSHVQALCAKGRYEQAIGVLVRLGDAAALSELGRVLEKSYDEKFAQDKAADRYYPPGNTRLADSVTSAFKAAKELGDVSAGEALLSWGKKLAQEVGFKPVAHEKSWGSSSEPNPLEALIASGLSEGLVEAAKAYRSFCAQRHSRRDARRDLERAVELFSQAGDAASAREVILELAARSHLGEALSLLSSQGARPDLALLRQLIDLGLERAAREVKSKVAEYLAKKEGDCPFYTAYTFWHFSNSNDEWREFRDAVSRLTGRAGGDAEEGIARLLYADTEKRPKIEALHLELSKHLLVGYMLSALSLEARYGSATDRKYEHPGYAAWRTFYNAVENGRYNPFEDGIVVSGDKSVMRVYEAVSKFEEEAAKLCVKGNGGLEDTMRSRAYRSDHIWGSTGSSA